MPCGHILKSILRWLKATAATNRQIYPILIDWGKRGKCCDSGNLIFPERTNCGYFNSLTAHSSHLQAVWEKTRKSFLSDSSWRPPDVHRRGVLSRILCDLPLPMFSLPTSACELSHCLRFWTLIFFQLFLTKSETLYVNSFFVVSFQM